MTIFQSEIAQNDARNQGSKPTEDMFNWLAICVELREMAVAARRRHRDLYDTAREELPLSILLGSSSSPSPSSSTDATEDAEEDAGMTTGEEDDVEDLAPE